MTPPAALAARLPDLPRWVELRALLRSGEAQVTALREAPALACVVRDPDGGDVFVVGRPASDAVRAAAHAGPRPGAVIVPAEHADHVQRALPGWAWSPVRLHTLPDPGRLPPTPAGTVALLDPARLDALTIPDPLRAELRAVAPRSPIAVGLADGVPVAFCYAGAITESLWDVSIDTLAGHRRQGHAARCATHLVRVLQPRGLRPVWAALEENPASWRLAGALGFVAVDAQALFSAPSTPHPPTA